MGLLDRPTHLGATHVGCCRATAGITSVRTMVDQISAITSEPAATQWVRPAGASSR